MLNKKLETVSSPVLNSFTTLLICIANEKGITLAEQIKEMKDKNINLEKALKADSKKPKTKEEMMEEETKPEIQRSTCSTCIVRTEEALIFVENNGVNNVHSQNCS